MVRDTTAKKDGRKIVMVFGVLALPDNCKLKGEHQYPIAGRGCGKLILGEDEGVDLSEQSIGDTPSGLLMRPIWRV